MKRFFGLLAGAAFALAANAQGVAPKIAISSLVADTITVKRFEQRTGSNLGSTTSTVLDVGGPVLDIAVLQAAQKAASKAAPGAAVYPLRVAKAASSGDPAAVVADGKVVAANALVEGLRQQGFTHLITATRHRGPNSVRLHNGALAREQDMLEGLGFYIDPVSRLMHVETGERATGLIAPYVYIQLTLVDLQAMAVRGTRVVAATALATSPRHNAGLDAWAEFTPEERARSLQQLIEEQVSEAVPLLFEAR